MQFTKKGSVTLRVRTREEASQAPPSQAITPAAAAAASKTPAILMVGCALDVCEQLSSLSLSEELNLASKVIRHGARR